MIDILIANNNQIAGEGLKTIIQSEIKNNVLGIVNSMEHLIQHSSKYSPDIIIIDYTHESFGFKAIKEIKKIYKNFKLLAITEKLSKSMIVDSLKNGINSYLLLDCDKPEILEAISETYIGKQFYCGLVIDIISEKGGSDNCSGITLSKRETQIIRLISEGCINKQIADQLFLSTHTVNTHRKNIMYKLGIKNTAGIVIYAVKENIIST